MTIRAPISWLCILLFPKASLGRPVPDAYRKDSRGGHADRILLNRTSASSARRQRRGRSRLRASPPGRVPRLDVSGSPRSHHNLGTLDAILPDGSVNESDQNGDNMVSFNHYAFGSVGEFYYTHILGIRPLEPGYRKILIAPVPDARLEKVSGQLCKPQRKDLRRMGNRGRYVLSSDRDSYGNSAPASRRNEKRTGGRQLYI